MSDNVAPRPAPAPGSPPSRAFGRTGAAGSPQLQKVRASSPNFAQQEVMLRTRSRLLVTAGLFTLLFAGVAGKLTWATVIHPKTPPAAESRGRA